MIWVFLLDWGASDMASLLVEGSDGLVVGVVVNGVLIFELEECALEFGLFALGFVFFPHRCMMHGKRQGEGKATAGVGAERNDLWGREVWDLQTGNDGGDCFFLISLPGIWQWRL